MSTLVGSGDLATGNEVDDISGLDELDAFGAANTTQFGIASPAAFAFVFTGASFNAPAGNNLPTAGTITGLTTYAWDTGTSQFVATSVWSGFSFTVAQFLSWVADADAAAGASHFVDAIFGGDDTITGTAQLSSAPDSDELWGYGGNDTVSGLGGTDQLHGGDGDDLLIGGADADQLDGGAGNDTARFEGGSGAGVHINLLNNTASNGDATGDTFFSIENIIGSGFRDFLTGDAGANTLSGEGADDDLTGGDGNDLLIGGHGADLMIGGAGIDTASYIDAPAAVSADLGAGAGSVGEAAGDTLTDIENLIGSSHDDQLTGSSGANTLNGGAGDDTMAGGLGNDIYVVDAAGDITTEASGAFTGVDTVQSSVSRTVSANIEQLTLTGIAAINGTGNSLANVLTGNTKANVLKGMGGADTLTGGGGKDTLTGNAGADKFVFNVAATAANADVVTDFTHNSDTIQLENSVFTALGAAALNLGATKFWIGANAHDRSDRVIYDDATGKLYYDADGNRAGAKVLIATLDDGLNLTASDFQVI